MSTLSTSEDGRISFNRAGEPVTDSTLTFDVNTQTLNVTNLNINGTTTEPPAGADAEIQFNDDGAFGSDSTFTFNSVTKRVNCGGISGTGVNEQGGYFQCTTSTAATPSYGFASEAYSSGSENVGDVWAGWVYVEHASSGTAASLVGLYFYAPGTSGGTVSGTTAALFMEDQGTTNYAIKTGTGLVSFGDRVQSSGPFVTTAHSVPADGALAAGELAVTFDQTNGAAKVKFKGKSANGTVVSGEVALS